MRKSGGYNNYVLKMIEHGEADEMFAPLNERSKSAADAAADDKDHDAAFKAGTRHSDPASADYYGADKSAESPKGSVGKGPGKATDTGPKADDSSKGVQGGQKPNGAAEIPNMLCDKEDVQDVPDDMDGKDGAPDAQDVPANLTEKYIPPKGWELTFEDDDGSFYFDKMLPHNTLMTVNYDPSMNYAGAIWTLDYDSPGAKPHPTAIDSGNIKSESDLTRFIKIAEKRVVGKLSKIKESGSRPFEGGLQQEASDFEDMYATEDDPKLHVSMLSDKDRAKVLQILKKIRVRVEKAWPDYNVMMAIASKPDKKPGIVANVTDPGDRGSYILRDTLFKTIEDAKKAVIAAMKKDSAQYARKK